MTRSFPALILGALLLAACSQQDGPKPHIGYVEADWVYVAAPQGGWIVGQPVREGDKVQTGDLLFRLDETAQEAALAEAEARIRQSEAEVRNLSTGARTAEIRALEARLREAQARLTQAIAERDRLTPLIEDGIVASSRADTIEAEVDAANASVDALKQDIAVARLAARPAVQDAAAAATESAKAASESATYLLQQRSIVAGIDGSVEDIFLRPGEYAVPGAPVLALLPQDGLIVRFFVPQAELPSIRLGTPVRIVADGLGAPFEAPVSYISPQAEYTPPVIYSRDARQKLVFAVEARVSASSGLHPGLPVEVAW
ncbi:MAG: HlyD family efflux transporter periplasmic adaptor subunit [Hyphomonas sp.]|nr:HlyD family efflux transporter periplasmic adaptor subunit [Hyphomonas sp.]